MMMCEAKRWTYMAAFKAKGYYRSIAVFGDLRGQRQGILGWTGMVFW